MEEKNQAIQKLKRYSRILQNKAGYYNASCRAVNGLQDEDYEARFYLFTYAPVVVEFVEWVLKKAVENGEKRLYFLARDGYPMYEAAKEICKMRKLEIECRYLYVSRYALRVPSYHLMGEQCIEQICTDGINITFYKIMKRAALSDVQIIDMAGKLGYENKIYSRMNRVELLQLKERLKSFPPFYECVEEHSIEAYENTIGYLEQEGLFEDVEYRFVDSGWTGTLQNTLDMLLKSRGAAKNVKGYYFGLYEVPEGVRERYEAFYFVPERNVRRKVYFSNSLFETIITSPEGMTLSYLSENDSYRPVVSDRKCLNRAKITKHIEELRQFVSFYVSETDSPKDAGDCYLTEKLMTSCMGKPCRMEAELFGQYLFSDDVLEDDCQQVGICMTEEEIRQHFFIAKLKSKVTADGIIQKDSAWIEGSVVRSMRGSEGTLWRIRMYQYFIAARKTLKGIINA